MKGLFMNNTAFAKEIAEMTDTDVERQWESAHNLLHGECYCGDHEARAATAKRLNLLAVELKRRRDGGRPINIL